MSLRRIACAMVIAIAIGACAVGSSAAKSDDDRKPSWKKPKESSGATHADRIALDALGDAGRGVDIQSLAIFNRKDLDFVGLSVTGRDFRVPTTRSAEVYLDTTPKSDDPNYRIVAFNRARGDGPSRARIYRVKGWSSGGQERVDCDQLAVQFDIQVQGQIRVAVPRSCLTSDKGPLRVNASVWDQHPVAWGERPDPSKDTDVVPDSYVLTQPT